MTSTRIIAAVLAVLTVLCVSGLGLVSAADPVADKLPPSVKKWEISLSRDRSRSRVGVHPVRVYDDGRFDCSLMNDSGSIVERRGKLDARQQTRVLMMARRLVSSATFVPALNSTDHNPMADHLKVRSGSRSIQVDLDWSEPFALGVDEDVTEGVEVFNAILTAESDAPEFSGYKGFFRVPHESIGSTVERDRIVPKDKPGWDSVSIVLANKKNEMSITVYRDRYVGVELRIRPELYTISKEERSLLFDVASNIINSFTLDSQDHDAPEAELNCEVRIASATKAYTVKFPVDDQISGEWRSQLRAISMIGHKRDESAPLVPEKPAGTAPEPE